MYVHASTVLIIKRKTKINYSEMKNILVVYLSLLLYNYS